MSNGEQQKHINTLTNEKLTLQAKVDELQATITKMKAQRIAYASEFECDEGSIHENIRTLKATITELREFVETVEGALGGATGDDIRVHVGPALAALK